MDGEGGRKFGKTCRRLLLAADHLRKRLFPSILGRIARLLLPTLWRRLWSK
jgi:hypothetical protein